MTRVMAISAWATTGGIALGADIATAVAGHAGAWVSAPFGSAAVSTVFTAGALLRRRR